MSPVESIIIDAVRAGVLLYRDGQRLRYKALDRLPRDLAQRLRANRDAVLELLATSAESEAPRADGEPQPEASTPELAPGPAAEGQAERQASPLDTAEAEALAQVGTSLEDMPLAALARESYGARIEAVERAGGTAAPVPAKPRARAAALIGGARAAGDLERAVFLRDAWRERVAICTGDGKLPQGEAERVAVQELESEVKAR